MQIVSNDGKITVEFLQLILKTLHQHSWAIGIGTDDPKFVLDIHYAFKGCNHALRIKNSIVSDDGRPGGQITMVGIGDDMGHAKVGDALLANEIGSLFISPNAPGKRLAFISGLWTNQIQVVLEPEEPQPDGTIKPGRVGINKPNPVKGFDVGSEANFDGGVSTGGETWKLGGASAAALAPDSVIRVTIGGRDYDILAKSIN